MENKKTYFFGWANFKWIVTELVKLYSDEKSYFSKKRIESGTAFVILQAGMVFWLGKKYTAMSTPEFIMWTGVEVSIISYKLYQIQKEKKE